jgi:hypothetical protein
MKKTTVGKYTGYAEFTPRRAGVFVFKLEKYLKIARVYKVKSGKEKGEAKMQSHRHNAVERRIHRSNDWLSIAPDLILPLIKILQEQYVELVGEEVPEVAAFEKVSEDKELTDAIKKIGL